MPEMTAYEHGVPCWADLGTSELPAAVGFYSELFGWEGQDQGEETGHYTIMVKEGRQVAALSPMQNDPGPPHWSTYINVTSVDDATARAEKAGGKILLEPMDVMEHGRMAVFADATGAAIAVWQPGKHIGAQLVNEPGSMIWNELSTSDLARSKAFYSEVFGWTWGGSDEYAEFQVAGRTVGGVMPRPAELPPQVPDNWLVYFATADLESDLARATGLGAAVILGATEIPDTGRFGVLMDPQGAAFALFQP